MKRWAEATEQGSARALATALGLGKAPSSGWAVKMECTTASRSVSRKAMKLAEELAARTRMARAWDGSGALASASTSVEASDPELHSETALVAALVSD